MSTHTPTNFNPADYEVLDYLDNKRPAYCGGPSEAYALFVKQWEGDMARVLGDDWRGKIHRCVHCGNARVRYITAVAHRPTGDRVVFGADCTARLGFPDTQSFKLALLKKRADTQAANLKAHQAKEAFLAAHPDVAAFREEIKNPVHAKNTFAFDVMDRFERFGSLSDRQIEALVSSFARDHQRAAKRAIEDAEPKGEAPVGRVTVTGTVLSIQIRDTDFGAVTKCLIKLTNNARVWTTLPRASEAKQGDAITLKATWERSKDDPSFGFGKRPSLVAERVA